MAELTMDGERAGQRQAKRREHVRAAMDKAAAELASIKPARIANSDAVALASYVTALGLALSPDTMNRLLTLLAVLIVECGGGLALAVGMALHPEILVEQKAGDGDQDAAGRSSSPNGPTTTAAQPVSMSMPAVANRPSRQRSDMSTARPPRRGRQSKATAEKRIVDAIRGCGGRLEGGSVRRLAKMVTDADQPSTMPSPVDRRPYRRARQQTTGAAWLTGGRANFCC